MTDRIWKNIKAREAAATLIEIGEETVASERLDGRKFWVAVAAMASDRAGISNETPETLATMTDDQSRQFGSTSMPFGQYRGTRVDEVPLDYLSWIADDQFLRDLPRYLRSRRVQMEDRG